MSKASEVALERWLLEQIVFGYFVDHRDLLRVFKIESSFDVVLWLFSKSTSSGPPRYILSTHDDAMMPPPDFTRLRQFVEMYRPDLVQQLTAMVVAYQLDAPPLYTHFGLEHEPQEDP